jgi:LexA DNA binding domain
MGRPVTFLEGLCAHALGLDVHSFRVIRLDRHLRAFAQSDGSGFRILDLSASSSQARELRESLRSASRKPVRAVLNGQLSMIQVQIIDELGDGSAVVTISPAPRLDPSVAPKFTAKQGQYLAYIYNYTKIHRCAPSEADLQRHFQVSAPSIHEMIKTLERNGLIEKTPGQARSIRLVVASEHLPRLQ